MGMKLVHLLYRCSIEASYYILPFNEDYPNSYIFLPTYLIFFVTDIAYQAKHSHLEFIQYLIVTSFWNMFMVVMDRI